MRSAIDAIVGSAGLGAALEKLNALPPNQAQSVLLGVFDRLAARTPAGRMLSKYEGNRFVQPGRIPPERMLELELLAFRLKPEGFEGVELSPVTPLGSASGFGCVSQHKVISACRGVEVVSDATNALALECASRRKRGGRRGCAVHLCAAHRLMRAQQFQNPNLLAHFNMFSLCSAGRDAAFEADAVRAHALYHVRLLREVFAADAPLILRLGVGNASALPLADAVRTAIRPHGDIRVIPETELTGGNYYDGFRFQFGIEKPGGGIGWLADGGSCDWSARLLSDARERLITSGMPLEALALMAASSPARTSGFLIHAPYFASHSFHFML